jgi:HK97 family phage major capsid protein
VADVVARLEGDFDASQRLGRHMSEERVERGHYLESRAVGTGAYAGLTVPQYLTDLVALPARAMRPLADICTNRTLPGAGMSVNISRITTGASAAVQATENTNASETDQDDTLLTVPVVTISGRQTVSRQAVERGTGIDDVILGDLVNAYHTTLDSQLLNGSGGSGEHQGLQTLSGVVGVTFTNGAPTAALLWPNLFNLISQVQSGVFAGVTHFVMHPRRFWWIASNVGTSFPFVQLSGSAAQTGGNVAGTAYGQGASGILAGIPVIVDGNVTTTNNTTQDVIYGVTASELHLWEDPQAPLFIRAEQPKAISLGIDLVVYGYSAFTGGRYPGAHGRISGSGLTTPTF